ncbi:hypothetical protein [Rhizobium arsenicireducens]
MAEIVTDCAIAVVAGTARSAAVTPRNLANRQKNRNAVFANPVLSFALSAMFTFPQIHESKRISSGGSYGRERWKVNRLEGPLLGRIVVADAGVAMLPRVAMRAPKQRHPLMERMTGMAFWKKA